jgi:hypothetical protein
MCCEVAFDTDASIRSFLQNWAHWWATTSESWTLEALLDWFIVTCWEIKPAAVAAGVLQTLTLRHTESVCAAPGAVA